MGQDLRAIRLEQILRFATKAGIFHVVVFVAGTLQYPLEHYANTHCCDPPAAFPLPIRRTERAPFSVSLSHSALALGSTIGQIGQNNVFF